jgi:transcription elongation factor GreA
MDKEPLTLYGYNKLSKEIEYIKLTERPAVLIDLEIALEHGDLKENSEYHASKEKRDFLDTRLEELGGLLARAQIIDPSTLGHERISFGSTVVLEDMNTEEEIKYTIVGGIESNPDIGLISFNSPLAKQILGKKEGDEVLAKLPGGKKEYEIISVSYEEINFGDK